MARADLHNSSLPAPPPDLTPDCLPDCCDDTDDSPRVRMATRHLTRLTGNEPGAPNTRSFLKYYVSVIITLWSHDLHDQCHLPGELDCLNPLCSVVRIQIQRPDNQVMQVDLGDCLDILPASD